MGADRGDPPSGADSIQPGLHDWESAALWLGVSPRLVRELWAKRRLGGVKVGRCVRFRDQDLDDFIERNRVDPH